MAKRKSGEGAVLVGIAVLIGVPIWLVSKMTDGIGPAATILAFAALILAIFLLLRHRRAVRLAHLIEKYGDPSIAHRIMRHIYWEGQTREQLQDSLGSPVSVDDMRMKTRRREIWKYSQQGKNRFGLRITLDNDVVTSWERKT